MKLSELLARKDIILLDGAMGTELANQGVDIGLPLWSANALIKAPQIVRKVHSEYLRAGADVITTNTFRSNRRAMEKTGMEDRWAELNRISVELAFEARERYPIYRPVLIAGSMAPVEDCYSPDLVPDEKELLEEHRAQADLIAQLGVDFILAETLITVREAETVAKAASETMKEFAVSFFCKDEEHLLSGETLAKAVDAVLPYGPTAVLVNCIHYREINRTHKTLQSLTTLPTGCYANTGNPMNGEEDSLQAQNAMEYAEAAESWVEDGARIVGGCCGTTPDHIYAVKRGLHLRSQKKV